MITIMIENDLATILIITGVILITIEALSPGAFIIVIGTGFLIFGIILSITGDMLTSTIGAIITSGISFGISTYFYRKIGVGKTMTAGPQTLTGKEGKAIENFKDKKGIVMVEGAGRWSARSTDRIKEGDEIIVTGGEGNFLRVEKRTKEGKNEGK